MAIKKLHDGRYELDIYPLGSKGPRLKRIRSTKRECRLLEADILREYKFSKSKFIKDERRLSELVNLWHRLHGHTLKDSKYRLSRTLQTCDRLGNPRVFEFTTDFFSNYRKDRLKKVSISTVNHETRYLRSVFNELKRLGYYYGDNPLLNIRTFTEKRKELLFLTIDQIKELLLVCDNSSNTHLTPIVKLCLSTGARWSEANNLKAVDLYSNRVVFTDTKNTKSRSIPITKLLYDYLIDKGFPTNTGRLFDYAMGAFRKAIENSSINLPRGQSTHVLRHTYASHFMMNGGNILTLQKILDHSDLKVTMRYAHLSPDYMQQAIDLNPMSFL